MNLKIRYPSVSKRKISVNSFSNGMKGTLEQKRSDLSRATWAFNFDYSDGILKNGLGVTYFKEFSTVNINNLKMLGIYEYIRFNEDINDYENLIIYYLDDKRLYWVNSNGGNVELLSDTVFETKPAIIQYNYLDKDVLLISSPSSGLYYLDYLTLVKIEDAPEITSLCAHKERIFATSGRDGKSLWFSDDFDPTNWAISLNEAGFINFADRLGKLIKAVSFLDSVYVFREYGITRVVAYGDQEEFSADNLFGNHGKIYGNSVTECGDFIIMVTSAGIFSFNGLNATKILSEYDEYLYGIDNQNAKGVYRDNKVFIKLNMKFFLNVESVILVYDVAKKSSYIARGLNIEDFCFFSGNVNEVLCVTGDDRTGKLDLSGCCFEKNLTCSWSSELCDFSLPDVSKNLYKVTLFSSKKATLTIEGDGKVLSYELKPNRVSEIAPCLTGYKFRFAITSVENGVEISNLCAYISYVRGN